MPNGWKMAGKTAEGALGGAAVGSMILPGVGTAIGAGLGGLYGLYAGWQGGQEEETADNYNKQAEGIWNNNPYSASNPGLTHLLAQQQGYTQRKYGALGAGIQSDLARRGLSGSSYGNSAMRSLGMERARALSGNYSQATSQNYDKQATWNQGRAGFYGQQQDLHQKRADDIYSDASDLYSSAASLAGWGAQNKMWSPTTTSTPPATGGLQSLNLNRQQLNNPMRRY